MNTLSNSSAQQFERASKTIPGGVNSPVRAFKAVGGHPRFIDHAEGATVTDVDGNTYIDYVGSWGPMILGHAHPEVIAAVHKASQKGLSFGAPTETETLLAEKICQLLPSIEQIRMVNSGTEATMSAIRLARGYTQRDLIIKFEGCYHGHADALLVKAGSGALTLGQASSQGVPKGSAENTIVLNYNDCEDVRRAFERYDQQIAAVIVEPVAGNMNCILPKVDFLKTLRQLCDDHQSILIFDEVMTGFRVHLGGAQTLYDIKPDLTTLGKVIGGGMPVGAFGGSAQIMRHLAPLGPVYQAGTLSGNPVAMAAGLKTLELVSQPDFYEPIFEHTQQLCAGLEAAANKADIALRTQHCGSMFGIFFTSQDTIETFAAVQKCHLEHFQRFFQGMLDEGIYFAPSAFEAGFISAAHNTNSLQKTLYAAEKILQTLEN